MACIDCRKYATRDVKDGYTRTPVCEWAAMHGHLDCIRYWFGLGFDLGYTASTAAAYGYVDCMRFAHENGGEWNNSTCNVAAQMGHTDCLRYAHRHDAPWDERTTYMAAAFGNLECLRYAHRHGAPWHSRTCIIAAHNGHLSCLRYAIRRKAPLTDFPEADKLNSATQDCFRFFALYKRPTDLPEIAEWRDRVRATAAMIMRIVRRNRARHAAITIQRFWLDRHYTPGGRGAVLVIERLRQ